MTELHYRRSRQTVSIACLAVGALLILSGPAWAECGSTHSSTKNARPDGLSACSAEKDIVDTAVKAGSFTILLKAATAAGMVDTLKGPGPFTVFAPTDEAFAELPAGTIEALLADLPKLRAILKYHVVPGRLAAKDVVSNTSVRSVLGQELAIDTSEGVTVANADVVKTNIAASNGIIHVIDSVMLPKPDIVDVAAGAGQFRTLLTAASAAGMLDTLRGPGPITVLAPTDAAFAKLPKGTVERLVQDPSKLRTVLKYHVIPGAAMAADVVKLSSARTSLGQEVSISHANGVKVNDAHVVKADIVASNGVIHVIDTVLLPEDDIVDVARKAGSFSTLLLAVEAAGLTDALRGEGPLTVFAPTDEAFAGLSEGVLDGLLKDPQRLRSVLTYHVVGDHLSAAELSAMNSVRTVQGQSLRVSTSGGVMVNEATVAQADISAANGTIHVIDRVVLPPTKVSMSPSSQ